MFGIQQTIEWHNQIATKLQTHAAGFSACRLCVTLPDQIEESETAMKAYGRHRKLKGRSQKEGERLSLLIRLYILAKQYKNIYFSEDGKGKK